jgi:hypothetical protein
LTSSTPADASAFRRGALQIDDCVILPVAWSAQDLSAARALLAVPDATITGALARAWEHWIDPRVGTDELLAAVGLPPAGPFDHVDPIGGGAC